jgi:molybdopterin converting factor small subunit
MFAAARQLAGDAEVSVSIAEGGTIADLRRQLGEDYPGLVALLPHVRFAIGTEYVEETFRVPSASEVACIPPVSGG